MKTYTRWITGKLHEYYGSDDDGTLRIDGLRVKSVQLEDLSDGVLLLRLIAALTGTHFDDVGGFGNDLGNIAKQKNLTRALEYLKTEARLEPDADPANLLKGDERTTLALIWKLLLHYHLRKDQAGIRRTLFAWCHECVQDYQEHVQIFDLSSSWRSGRAFAPPFTRVNRY